MHLNNNNIPCGILFGFWTTYRSSVIKVAQFKIACRLVLSIVLILTSLCFLCFYFLIYFIDFSQRGRERDRELETSMRERHRPAASSTPPTGDVPTTNVHALDWNRTWDLSVRRPTLYHWAKPVSAHCGFFKFFYY